MLTKMYELQLDGMKCQRDENRTTLTLDASPYFCIIRNFQSHKTIYTDISFFFFIFSHFLRLLAFSIYFNFDPNSILASLALSLWIVLLFSLCSSFPSFTEWLFNVLFFFVMHIL